MTKTRREFAPEFKREPVALFERSGRPLMQVATKVGISPSMLRNWRASIHTGAARSRAVAAGVPQLPSPADQAAEIARLKRDLDRTPMERDVLKNDRGSGSACGRRNGSAPYRELKGAAVRFLVVYDPVKKHGPWAVASLRVVTCSDDPDWEIV